MRSRPVNSAPRCCGLGMAVGTDGRSRRSGRSAAPRSRLDESRDVAQDCIRPPHRPGFELELGKTDHVICGGPREHRRSRLGCRVPDVPQGRPLSVLRCVGKRHSWWSRASGPHANFVALLSSAECFDRADIASILPCNRCFHRTWCDSELEGLQFWLPFRPAGRLLEGVCDL